MPGLKELVEKARKTIEEKDLDEISYTMLAYELDISPSYAREVLKTLAEIDDRFMYVSGRLKRVKPSK